MHSCIVHRYRYYIYGTVFAPDVNNYIGFERRNEIGLGVDKPFCRPHGNLTDFLIQAYSLCIFIGQLTIKPERPVICGVFHDHRFLTKSQAADDAFNWSDFTTKCRPLSLVLSLYRCRSLCGYDSLQTGPVPPLNMVAWQRVSRYRV